MVEATIESLLKWMRKEGFNVQIQRETNQIYCSLKLLNGEFPLFVRIFDESELVQLIVFFPTHIQEKGLNDLSRTLHHLNKEIDLPGFGMDESSKVAFYRLMLPAFNKQIDQQVLKSYLKSVNLICENFGNTVISVANGVTSVYASILKKNK